MTQHSPVRSKSGGLSGGDKQQDARRDQNTQQGVVQDERGQDQPKDKKRAQQHSGLRNQKDAATNQPPSPGEPAGGE